MQSIQLIGITPEQFQSAIIEGVKTELNELKKQFQPIPQTQLLTRKEVAKMLSINLSTLHFWVKNKRLNAYSIGHRVYFKRKEVEAALIQING